MDNELLNNKEFKKYKKIFCGELLLFGVIFLVLGILFLTDCIEVKEWKYWVFPILTLLGGTWLIIDLVWMIKSKKRQEKNSFIDKILPLPCAVVVIGFDIYFLINNSLIGDASYDLLFRTVIGTALSYYSLVYLFEGIYHYFKPSKSLIHAFEEDNKKEEQKAENK